MRKEVDVESKRNIVVICNKTQLLWYQSFIKSIKREKSVYTWVETQTAWREDLISGRMSAFSSILVRVVKIKPTILQLVCYLDAHSNLEL